MTCDRAAAASSLDGSFIDESLVSRLVHETPQPDAVLVRDVLAKARALGGLSLAETACLLRVDRADLVHEIFAAARKVKDAIYGKRLVLFAPLYFSSFCTNSCLYCGFRRENREPRRQLSLEEIAAETRALVDQGHKRVLLIGGEDDEHAGVEYLLRAIETIYATGTDRGDIRRVNVETAPLDVDGFRQLKSARIGTYVLFQETYHRKTYAFAHPRGPKADFLHRLFAMDRAMTAGIHDVGIGALFGLHDYRSEVLSLLLHAQHLEETFGVGPHTISVPRIEPAAGAPLAQSPPCPVRDEQFKQLVAILRLAVPYTGIILSTRESAALRGELLDLGVSQLSAGSSTEPGGYSSASDRCATRQFAIGDQRPLDHVVADIVRHGYIPSFCTGCYRKGRTGQDFMDLAKPGLIRSHCLPNALLTFREYLLDYATPGTRELGEQLIREQLDTEVPAALRGPVDKALARIQDGARDIYF
ncbi:MAG: [FeFe] hydrogenase H-cluster radical SAM maturase HydG [Planctomycetes bacterium]|nr:[FeFe] hydrogenase H-cluster radical SAM maturase HydG [Planctomycetota bacterium]